MTLIQKVFVSCFVLLALSAKATTQETATTDKTTQLVQAFVAATLEAGRCTGSWDCKWPTTQCVKNRCVKPNGDGGDCNGSWDCKWPTTSCEHGVCVKPGGSGTGGECTGSWDCKWPYTSCKNGFCERP